MTQAETGGLGQRIGRDATQQSRLWAAWQPAREVASPAGVVGVCRLLRYVSVTASEYDEVAIDLACPR